MKRTVLIFFLSLIPLTALAPGFKQFYIPESNPINFYDPLIRAVVEVESKGDPLALNNKEMAYGAFQIRWCRVDHYNKLNGTAYTLQDCYDYKLSRDIFLFFAHGKTYEKAAKDWNGSGRQTKIYWQRIKKQLQAT